MNIYLLNYTENEERFYPFLSEQRKSAADNVKNPAVRREKIYSYALLRYALFRDCGITEPPLFSYGEIGKPYLKNTPEVSFSLSHAGGCTACAAYDFPVGLDIQDIRPLKADISRKICTPAELAALPDSENSAKELCRLWCIKESVGKLTGMGFAEGFTGIETKELIENGKTLVKQENNLYISVSCHEPLPHINLISVSEDELYKILADLR